MENKISDYQILKDYYKKIYGSNENWYSNRCQNETIRLSRVVRESDSILKFFTCMFVASIYYLLFMILNGARTYYFGIIALLFSLFLLFFIRANQKESERKYKDAMNKDLQWKESYKMLIANTQKPPIPEDKLRPEHIKGLLAVFESGRASTFKEALIIYEQDRQHSELIAQQNATSYQAYQTQQQSEQAKEDAEWARREADYARREAEYYQDQADYYRSTGDSSSADYYQGESDYYRSQSW